MKSETFDMWMGALIGSALTITFFGTTFATYEFGCRHVWKKAVKAGVAVQVDGEYEFIKEKR